MAEQHRKDVPRSSKKKAPRNLPPGVKLVRTLRGHTGIIGRIAWSPDGRMLASPSEDATVRLWDVETGETLRIFAAPDESYSVAFDPTGRMLASGSRDRIVLWDVATGKPLQFLDVRSAEHPAGYAYVVAFDPTGRMLASGGDGGIDLWDVATGNPARVLEAHPLGHTYVVAFDPTGRMLASSGDGGANLWDVATGNPAHVLEVPDSGLYTVAFDPTGRTLASGNRDKIDLWGVVSGKLLLTLEGHTLIVDHLQFSPDGRLLASKGVDDTVRLWRCDTWETIAVLPEPKNKQNWWPGLAFHPRLDLLATVGSDPDTDPPEIDRLIHIWELNLALLLGQPVAPTVTYTSAKVVLVGESNVGKSYLAHRIATGSPPEEGVIKSTHGMKFWPLEPERLSATARAPEGQRRDVVLWDMGGQEEYRLIHQLFLHDTTLALVLLDPTRGATAFKEVETWNKYLDKQLRGRQAVKVLVGAKLDQRSDTIDRQALERLRTECGFSGYYETSALTGRGVAELCEAAAQAIDWEGLGVTSRPELFQRIRDEIEARRKRGEVVLQVADLHRALSDHPPTEEEEKAVNAVTAQLATQGVIARSWVSTGEPVLVLQVQEIERYAGSLIITARTNPRGVPALELKAIAQADLALPGISTEERLSPDQEKAVLECTVQLMLEHGICFQHEGLLIFPTLFAPSLAAEDTSLRHAVSLYYDFAGAIDNIYASLVAWLVLARDFGRVWLWADQAEFEVKDEGTCGLRKVGRSGGFAHLDVYFEESTPPERQELFISFVEEHVRRHGVEIREHVEVTCTCGEKIEEEIIRKRIARGEKDVRCPVCETRHDIAEGAAESRQRNPQIERQTWALKTEIVKRREQSTEQAVQVIERTSEAKPANEPIRLLHLSDLHFTAATPVQARLQWLLDDLKQDRGLGFRELDYLVVSGDFTDRGHTEGFEKAYEFVSGLTQEFDLSAERCVFVPGNHDVVDLQEAYEWRKKADNLKEGEWIKQGDIVLARNAAKYPMRFKPFSDWFYHRFLQRPYPTNYQDQGMAIPYWETGIQFLILNSCWQIDEFYRKRSGVLPEAVANAIKQAQKQEEEALNSGQRMSGKPLLRIAVWHHAVTGPEQMQDMEFLGNLQKNGVRIGLHGDVHEMRRDLIGYRHETKLHVVGSGSFGARMEDRPESAPRLYNLLEVSRDLKSARVHTREQPKPDGPWDGWHQWDDPDGGKGRVPYYDIRW